ncbi:MAG: hypothetical protein ACYC2P_04465 [Paludibacteraceae bacterium]
MFIDKIKKLFFGNENDKEFNSISNQQIVEKVEKVFTEILKRDSVYERMIFDTDFLILVPPATYERVSLQAPALAKPIINKFYEVIRKQSAKFPDFTPLANYWNLQFAQKEFGNNVPKNEQIMIISKVTAERDWNETLKSEGAAEKISINGKHSKYSNWDINDEILQKIDILERGKVRVRFNKNLIFGDEKPQQKTPLANSTASTSMASSRTSTTNAPQEGLAYIKFRENDKNMNYTMRENQISIGKAVDNEKSTLKRLVIRTNESGFEENHMQIRFDPVTRIFYIAVFAPTRVNEQSLQISPISSPVWHTLTQNASILCGFYSIRFQALK